MKPAATSKLAAAVASAAFCIFLALAAGQAELVAVAAPFVVALVVALASTRTPSVEVDLTVSEDRCLEDEEPTATITLRSTGFAGEGEVGVGLPAGIAALDDFATRAVLLRPGETQEATFRLRTIRWGAHGVGPVALRLYGPGRLVVFESVVPESRLVKVYPTMERIRRGLRPPETHSFSGDYTSRAAGEGIEFATVRPFTRGDSVRRVNWRVTSRRGRLHVNLAHPERNADLMLFLDTFGDIDMPGGTTLDVTVRGAAAIAEHHLRHNDRVGLVGFGGALEWLTASMGRTHTYRIADFLLGLKTYFSYAWKDIELLPHGTLPASALVVAFSALVDERAVAALGDIAARGFSMVVVDILDESVIAHEPSPEGDLAGRVWRLRRDMVRARFRNNGVPVIMWSGEEGLDAVLAALPRRHFRFAGVHR